MPVPVQTWGSLGTMVTEQKDFGLQTEKYLEENEVYDLLAHLMRQVVIHQPADPVKFLKEQLKTKPPLSVVVIGPPGVRRSEYCDSIAKDYSVKHIHVGKLLKARKELREVIDSGSLVEDEVVIEIVKAELAKAKTGWVLDGFPRTKVQAQALALRETGLCLDKVIMLTAGEGAIRERYAAKAAASGVSGPDVDVFINARLQQYQRHVVSIAELFKNVLRQIEVGAGDGDLGPMYSVIKSSLHFRPNSNAPLRPPRICVVGPCGSGSTTQCKIIAKHYGLVHVELAPILRRHQKATGQRVEDVPPEYVSDEDLCSVVGARLNEIDCLRKGWVLDGFPRNHAQAEFMRQSHLWPSRLIALDASQEEIERRVSLRRIDPITCMAYYKPPNSVAVRQRLVQAEHDKTGSVAARWKTFKDSLGRLQQTFTAIQQAPLSAEMDVQELTKHVRQRIDFALPFESPDEDDS